MDCRFDLSFADSTFCAVRLDGSNREDEVVNFIEERIGASP